MANEIIKPINVFLGAQGSGKTRLAKELAKTFPEKTVAYISGRNMKDPGDLIFPFCTLKTSLLIIDDIKELDQLDELISFTHRYMVVKPKGRKAFLISPEVILICEDNITRKQIDDMGPHITSRCIIHEVEEYMLPTGNSTIGAVNLPTFKPSNF